MKKLRPSELKWLIETMELRQGLLGCGSLFPSADRVPSLPSSGSLSQLPLSAAQGHVALKMALPAGTLPPLWYSYVFWMRVQVYDFLNLYCPTHPGSEEMPVTNLL